jgi:Protein of unknown function (DUF2971)
MPLRRQGDEEPADDTSIWRYMDLTRFVLLTSEKKLRFTKLKELQTGDPYEGFGLAQGLRGVSKNSKPQVAKHGIAMALYREFSKHASHAVRDAPNLLYVNCWCMGPESLGMWMLYGGAGAGVAVKSTVGQFKTALARELRSEQYRFGKINYHADLRAVSDLKHNFRRGKIPASGNLWALLLKMAFHKREAYEYEREWRAAIYQDPRDISGVDIPVDLDQLTSEIYVGPRAGVGEFGAVQAIVAKAGLSQKIVKSDLLRALAE